MTKENPLLFIKGMLPVLLICLITGFLSMVLGIVNYKNNLLAAEANQMNQTGAYLTRFADSIDGEKNAQYLLSLIDALGESDEIYNEAVENCFIYDQSADVLYCSDETLDTDSILGLLKDQGFAETIANEKHYVPVRFDDNLTLVLSCDTMEITSTIRSLIPELLLLFLISFLVLSVLLLLVGWLIKKKQHLKTLTCVITFIWIFLISLLLALLSLVFFWGQVENDQTLITDNICEDVHNINAMSDEEVEDYAEMIYALVGDDYANALAQADGNSRLAVIYLNMSIYDHYSAYYSSVEALDELMVESAPMENRLAFHPDKQYLINYLLSYLLQILMLSSLAIVLIMEIFYYEEERIKARIEGQKVQKDCTAGGFSNPMSRFDHNFGDRLKLIFTVYRIASALISVVMVILLRRMVLLDYPVHGTMIITIVIFSGGLAEFCGQMLFYRIFLKLNNSIRFLQLSLILIAGGTLVCYFSGSAAIYIIGYLLLSFSMNIIFNTLSFHAEGIGTDLKAKRAMYRRVTIGGRVGNLIGFVLATAISTVVNDTTIFLIAFAILIFTLILTFGYSGKEFNYTVPEKISYLTIFKTPKLLVYAVLILIPAGFADYFMSYKVPLDIAALGLTVSLFSFLKYLRELTILCEKYKKAVKKNLKKIDTVSRASLLNAAAAIIILLYCLFSHLYTLVPAVILLALIRANFGSSVHYNNLALDGNDYGDSSRLSLLKSKSSSLSTSIASLLTEGIGFLSLPVIMILTASGYYYKQKCGKPAAEKK